MRNNLFQQRRRFMWSPETYVADSIDRSTDVMCFQSRNSISSTRIPCVMGPSPWEDSVSRNLLKKLAHDVSIVELEKRQAIEHIDHHRNAVVLHTDRMDSFFRQFLNKGEIQSSVPRVWIAFPVLSRAAHAIEDAKRVDDACDI